MSALKTFTHEYSLAQSEEHSLRNADAPESKHGLFTHYPEIFTVI